MIDRDHSPLTTQYTNQLKWRDWQQALSLCPLVSGQNILDMGCGPGDVTALLSMRGASVIGIDRDPDLIQTARERYPNCRFEQLDLRSVPLPVAGFDGLWCSFTAAYFVDFESVFSRWIELLKPSAWVCVIDMDDLFNHDPLSRATHDAINGFYEESMLQGRYDFLAGRKLERIIEKNGFDVRTCNLADAELAFSGAVDSAVLAAWRSRLTRMVRMQEYFADSFATFEKDFLRALLQRDHRSNCKVFCCIGNR